MYVMLSSGYILYKGMMRMEFIGILCLILISTTIGSHISRRLGIPAVIGQLLVGVLLGQTGLNWVKPDILVHDFSEIGVILLMFLAGLESDLSLLKNISDLVCSLLCLGSSSRLFLAG